MPWNWTWVDFVLVAAGGSLLVVFAVLWSAGALQ
jgi:hypothetical protein